MNNVKVLTRKEEFLIKLSQGIELTSQEVEECLRLKDNKINHYLADNPTTSSHVLNNIITQILEKPSYLTWDVEYKGIKISELLASHPNISEEGKWMILRSNKMAHAACQYSDLSDEMVAYAFTYQEGVSNFDNYLVCNPYLKEDKYYYLYDKYVSMNSTQTPPILSKLSQNCNTPLELLMKLIEKDTMYLFFILSNNKYIDTLFLDAGISQIRNSTLLEAIMGNPYVSSETLLFLFVNRFNKSFLVSRKWGESSYYLECFKAAYKSPNSRPEDIKSFISMGVEALDKGMDRERTIISYFLNRDEIYEDFQQYVLEVYGINITGLTDEMVEQALGWSK
jgi:hypothetical protein